MNKSYLTAIVRNKPSRPMTFLNRDRRLVGRTLDYGCGRGFDATCFDMERYDPHYFPNKPDGFFDTITCHYVLNVVTKKEQDKILADIRDMLSHENGVAYVTVRRDLKEDYKTKNSIQRVVNLSCPIIEETDDYCIYMVLKYEDGMTP